jgi:predicted nucleic acid-binding Zn ribbon protein
MNKLCIICGKEFEATNSSITCGKGCGLSLKARREREYRANGSPIGKTCVVCGNEFKATGGNKTCGKNCSVINKRARSKARHTPEYRAHMRSYNRARYHRNIERERELSRSRWNRKRKPKTCAVCKIEFYPIGATKTCGYECSQALKRVRYMKRRNDPDLRARARVRDRARKRHKHTSSQRAYYQRHRERIQACFRERYNNDTVFRARLNTYHRALKRTQKQTSNLFQALAVGTLITKNQNELVS